MDYLEFVSIQFSCLAVLAKYFLELNSKSCFGVESIGLSVFVKSFVLRNHHVLGGSKQITIGCCNLQTDNATMEHSIIEMKMQRIFQEIIVKISPSNRLYRLEIACINVAIP